jgi:hypothetical protein
MAYGYDKLSEAVATLLLVPSTEIYKIGKREWQSFAAIFKGTAAKNSILNATQLQVVSVTNKSEEA